MKQIISRIFNGCADGLVSFSRQFGRKAWLVFLLIFSLTFTILLPRPVVSQSQPTLRDIEGHWAQVCIEQLAQRNIISGYPDGYFRPDVPVTRAEFAAIVNKAFPNASLVRTGGGNFVDVSPSYWGLIPIRKAYQTGFLSGYPDRTFKPQKSIPRVEVVVSLVSGLNYLPSEALNSLSEEEVNDTLEIFLSDGDTIPDYAKPAVATAVRSRLVVNYPNVRQLQPNKLASRGEVAAFICQALGTPGTIPDEYLVASQLPRTLELRGVWLTNIDSDVLFSQRNLTEAVARLDELNFNTLYPTVWNWGYTLYPSEVAQRVTGHRIDPEEGLRNRDFLKEIIAQGHNKDMAVIPWFEFGFMAPADSDLAKRHPDWLTQRQDGSTIWMEGKQHERVWLNPLRPEVQGFVKDLLVELVSNYDVDGIQLDDHFGFPSDFGYDPFTVSLYQQEHNGNLPPSDFQDSEWIQWRADKITDYMKGVFRAVKDVNSNAIVALSPNPQEFSLESYLLDWEKWERLGLVEELMLQVYRPNVEGYIRELAQPEVQAAKNHIPVGIGILAGLKGRGVSSDLIQQQVQIARNQDFAGVSFFFYETLWNLTEEPLTERQATFKAMFPTEVERPNLISNPSSSASTSIPSLSLS